LVGVGSAPLIIVNRPGPPGPRRAPAWWPSAARGCAATSRKWDSCSRPSNA